MGKKDDLMIQIQQIMDDRVELERFIITNSNLPGPRGNLELTFAFAEVYDNFEVLLDWIEISEDLADVNDPRSFLPFCSAVCIGRIFTKTGDERIVPILKTLANDGRWRMRESVAFGFQIIGENDFNELRSIFSDWIETSNNLEKRAILVSLAHPPFLDEKNAEFCFEITDVVLEQMDRENDFDVLRRGLSFTISVFTAANPTLGFNFIKKWTGKDKIIDRIMRENLKKNRLARMNPEKVRDLLNEL